MTESDRIILLELLRADGAFVSGSDLAAKLGMSRVGVWARLEHFRNQGFEFEAVRHRGYRLTREPDHIFESLLRARLERIGADIPLHFLDSVDSTNSEAERLLAAGTETPFVVVSAEQTKGRGRLGRVWHSPRSGNLYASFAFRPDIPPAQMQTITLWLGALVCDELHRQLDVPIRIKWPNDLHIDGRKVAGMLTEARIDADRTRELVFGLGLNMRGDTAQWPAATAAVATTLSAHAAKPVNVNALAAALIATCVGGYRRYLDGAHTRELAELWQRYDALTGRTIEANHLGKPLRGEVLGITPIGALRVRTPDGQEVALNAGEVTLASRAGFERIDSFDSID